MPWTNTGRKAENFGGGVASLNVTLNSTVAGNFIALATSAWKGAGPPTAVAVSDGTNGAYTSAAIAIASTATAALSYDANNAGGNLTITADPSGGGAGDVNDMSVFAHEFSGGDTAAPLSGTPVTQASSTSPTTGIGSTGAMTPADNDVLLLAFIHINAVGAITENAGTEGFTLSNDEEGGSGQPGSLVFKILVGAPGTPSHSWTGVLDATFASVLAAFKPAVAAAGHPASRRLARSTPGLSPWGVRRM